MKRIIYGFFAVSLFLAASLSCTKQDDIYKKYVKTGGYVYPAKAVNLSAEAGYRRVTLRWDIPSDPSLRTAKVFWDNKLDSLMIDYSTFPDGKAMVIIPDLEDRSYTFDVVNYDSKGNRSLGVELSAAPYGDNWLVSHSERSVLSAVMSADSAIVVMSRATDEMVATKFRFRNPQGEWVEHTHVLGPQENQTAFKNVLQGKRFEYKSAFCPAKARDTVWTTSWSKSPGAILYALPTGNWTVTATEGQVNTTYTPDKIFDGKTASQPARYHSSMADADKHKFPKVLAIDTKAENGKEFTFVSLTFYLHPLSQNYRYIRDCEFYVGNTPFDPDAGDTASYGEYAMKATLSRNLIEQTVSVTPAKAGRYAALVFKNSYSVNGFIDLWELVPMGYVASEAD